MPNMARRCERAAQASPSGPALHNGRFPGILRSMKPWRPRYGPNSPFTNEERDTVDEIVDTLAALSSPEAPVALAVIKGQFEILESFGSLLASFPPTIQSRRRGAPGPALPTLVQALCRSTPADFDFQAPARVMPGRALDMTEMNFYRLLRFVCAEVVGGSEGIRLRDLATSRMRTVIYTKLVEELLSDLVSDDSVEEAIRSRAVYALVDIWDGRLTYRASDCFPLLQATWEARQRVKVVGGTLQGAQELFGLMREGCDPRFLDYFTRPDPDDEETAAFREFLFGASSEDLAALSMRMEEDGLSCLALPGARSALDDDPGTALYAFFRSRYLQAIARRLADTPGPKRTAEGYVMIMFLARGEEQRGAGC